MEEKPEIEQKEIGDVNDKLVIELVRNNAKLKMKLESERK